MPREITLDSAIDQIYDAIKSRLEDLRGDLLSDFESVIMGDWTHVGFDLPTLWVVPDVAILDPDGSGFLAEVWEIPVAMVAFAWDDDPAVGYREANRLAALARVGILKYDDDKKYRRLGLSFVNDVRSTSFEPARTTPVDNRTLFGAAAIVTVRFTVLERESV